MPEYEDLIDRANDYSPLPPGDFANEMGGRTARNGPYGVPEEYAWLHADIERAANPLRAV